METARPMSRFRRMVATKVTSQISWERKGRGQGSIDTKAPKLSPGSQVLTRSIRFDFQREQMSENCFIMPFRFTIMTAARTACSKESVTRAAEKYPKDDSPHL